MPLVSAASTHTAFSSTHTVTGRTSAWMTACSTTDIHIEVRADIEQRDVLIWNRDTPTNLIHVVVKEDEGTWRVDAKTLIGHCCEVHEDGGSSQIKDFTCIEESTGRGRGGCDYYMNVYALKGRLIYRQVAILPVAYAYQDPRGQLETRGPIPYRLHTNKWIYVK